MGMEVRVVLYADSGVGRLAATAAFARIRVLEDILSDYRDESEVRRLARRPGEWIPVSADLFSVLSLALELAEASQGAFDPTVGALVALWREARVTARLPDSAALADVRQRVGWRLVLLDSARSAARFARDGMRLDLGAVAKGYILDEALAAARTAGASRALIRAGGDIVTGDAPPGRTGWAIRADDAGAPIAAAAGSLVNAALSTSGDSEQFVMLGGVRYSHVLDARSGWPLTHRRRAWVIAPRGALADGLATALTIVGTEETAGLLARYPGVIAGVTPR